VCLATLPGGVLWGLGCAERLYEKAGAPDNPGFLERATIEDEDSLPDVASSTLARKLYRVGEVGTTRTACRAVGLAEAGGRLSAALRLF
jgi:hypothetical protein